MSDFIPPQANRGKVGGLSRAAQKLAAAREKAAQNAEHGKGGGKALASASGASLKTKDAFTGTKKSTFQRKAV
jgi:hypothetical protein